MAARSKEELKNRLNVLRNLEVEEVELGNGAEPYLVAWTDEEGINHVAGFSHKDDAQLFIDATALAIALGELVMGDGIGFL